MSDEQYGRAWAAQLGKCPALRGNGWCWYFAGSVSKQATVTTTLPRPLMEADEMRYGAWTNAHRRAFDSEAAAYAALGRAVRAVLAAVPPLKEQP